MESSKDDTDDASNYDLHKTIFDNDLKRLNNIIKYQKDVIDKKVSEIPLEINYLITAVA